jgi:FAD/FMN-containing dehydrogenase
MLRGRNTRSLLIAIACLLILMARPAYHLLRTTWNDSEAVEQPRPGFADDASRLNETPVAESIEVAQEVHAAERQIAELLRRAKAENKRVAIASARHTMGGHTIYPDGIVLNMLPLDRIELDESTDTLHAQAGARWSSIIPYLDARGLSVGVMQSNNSFSVGGSISANCHGWQFGRPPIASTVKSLRLMQADGSIVRCSRDENAELFSLVLGGYGLLGVILDVDLAVISNERYRLEQFVVPIEQSLAIYEEKIRQRPDARMVYGRMNVTRSAFLDEMIINVFYDDAGGGMPSLAKPGMASLRRAIFRGSAADDYGKSLRWDAETKLQPHLSGEIFSRNQLLNEGVELFENRSATSTDILHEYFIPTDGLANFVTAMKDLIPPSDANLLNVTVRMVKPDGDAFLRYADREMFSFVLLFEQARTKQADRQMESMTQKLIDAALAAGGRYYLPYRLHATRSQFLRAYPQATRFFELKRKYDPDELFQNEFYRKYGVAETSR